MPHKTKSGRVSQAWKGAERLVAKALGGTRISRGDNFAREDVDVVVPDLPELRIDAKYRVKHGHHRFMQEILDKYVTKDAQEPVLVTRHHRQHSAYVTIRLEYFAFLLNVLRAFSKEDK